MDIITDLNEIIYAGVKLVCDKIGIPAKESEQKCKTGKNEGQIKKQRQRAKTTK